MNLPIAIDLRPSRLLTRLLALVHAGAILVLSFLAVNGSVRIALVCVIVVSLGHLWRKNSRLEFSRLLLWSGGRIDVFRKVGAGETAVVQSGTVMRGNLILLVMGIESKRTVLTLLPDSADADALRRLRVWLSSCRRQ